MMPGDGLVRIGLLQWHPLPGEPEVNLATALALAHRAGKAGCRVVAMPELWPCGYDPASLARDVAAAAEPLDGPRGRALGAAAAAHGLWLIAGSVPELDGGHRYNTAPVYDPAGHLVARHRKFHRYGPGGEPGAFAAGHGPTAFDTGSALGTVGLAVCFDGDFPETGRSLRAAGARLVVEPAAYEYAAEGWWDRLYPAHALVNGQWWLLANQAGGPEGSGCFGRSRVIAPGGEVVAEAPRAQPGSDPEPEVLVVDVDLAGGWRDAADGEVLFEDRLIGLPSA